VAPFYTVRMRARACVARAALAAALFCLIAAALLAGAAIAAPAEQGDKDGATAGAVAGTLHDEQPDGATSGEQGGDGDGGSGNVDQGTVDAGGGGSADDGSADDGSADDGPADDGSADDDSGNDGSGEHGKDAGSNAKPGDKGDPGKPDKPEKPEKPDVGKPDKPDKHDDGSSGDTPDQGGTAIGGDVVENAVPAPPAVALPVTPVPATPQATPRSRTTPRGERRQADQRRAPDRPATGGAGGDGGGGSQAAAPAGGDGGGVANASQSGAAASARAAADRRAASQAAAEQRRRQAQESARKRREKSDGGSPVTRTVTRTVNDIVEVVPDSMKAALATLAALAVLFAGGYLFSTVRARRLARQRKELLSEVGLLQGALLPTVPAALGGLRTSVAYRPAEGPGAGGDFYDVVPLTGGRVGFILGDVSGHGRSALERTAFMRYTLRAYLEAGLEPRIALQVADRVIDENLGGDFATVVLAVHDPESGSLTYASAGHPAPIITGTEEHAPVTAASSPPIGVGVRTGLRQTTVPLEAGAVACFYTDGLSEARTEDGIMGRWRLGKLVSELGRDADAEDLLERVAQESRMLSDDMATVLISPTAGVTAGGFRTEQLEVSESELDGPLARRFLEACGVSDEDAEGAEQQARAVAGQFGGAVLHVVLGNRQRVEVLPRNVESIEAASRRAAAR
jgi:serine phosphatase RsbU (regulator of sigma subunit)